VQEEHDLQTQFPMWNAVSSSHTPQNQGDFVIFSQMKMELAYHQNALIKEYTKKCSSGRRKMITQRNLEM
jgi:hypothetical protein